MHITKSYQDTAAAQLDSLNFDSKSAFDSALRDPAKKKIIPLFDFFFDFWIEIPRASTEVRRGRGRATWLQKRCYQARREGFARAQHLNEGGQ